ncbi:hypothetical protein [Ghiorsea bivora]|uniref:hypothetical protein n=1 Tax=Ghiorsea bivora TaxID=1485545 RepID=UPI000570344C|nr:hypothetical protein [Ghiorsea bivora]
MDLNYNHAFWGILFAGIFYVVGNAAWVNKWARESRFIAILLWSVLGFVILLFAASFDMRLDPNLQSGIWERMTSVDGENHWIALTLYALLSTPGIAANLFSLELRMTRLALILPGILVFIPMGKQLEHPEGSLILVSIGATVAVVGILLLFQMLLDVEPEKKKKRKVSTA